MPLGTGTPTVTGITTIPLGATVLFTSTFSPSNPPGANVSLSYFVQGQLTTGSVTMTFQSGTTWTAQWDSGVCDGGRVDWEIYSTGGLPVAAQIGFFFLSSNDATVAGL